MGNQDTQLNIAKDIDSSCTCNFTDQWDGNETNMPSHVTIWHDRYTQSYIITLVAEDGCETLLQSESEYVSHFNGGKNYAIKYATELANEYGNLPVYQTVMGEFIETFKQVANKDNDHLAKIIKISDKQAEIRKWRAEQTTANIPSQEDTMVIESPEQAKQIADHLEDQKEHFDECDDHSCSCGKFDPVVQLKIENDKLKQEILELKKELERNANVIQLLQTPEFQIPAIES
jgi:hypothetical protein